SLVLLRRLPISTLFPYTTLFRSNILPHRYPFQLLDKIIHLDDESVAGVKNVTMNEPFFQGHFPGNPVMPGVLQVEAMAQTGGILDRKSTRLNSSHVKISYAVFCL